MASSGNYRKFRVDSLTGERYVHTINPLTGKSEKSDLLSATVLAPTCALADGYAQLLCPWAIKNLLKCWTGWRKLMFILYMQGTKMN
jgi:thiamine biosynthesis lipoprotein ApbE